MRNVDILLAGVATIAATVAHGQSGALNQPVAAEQTEAPTAATTPPETSDDREGRGIADIVVTAQKRAENIQDVPIAISAVGSAYLQARDVTSIDQLSSIAPNLKIERAPSNKTISQISLRGSVTINPAIISEPAVGLYVDGVYIAKAQGSIFDIADLERVEVLRGPQGTLYGRNTLAGAINLITKKPTGELGGKVEASYGNYDFKRVRGTVDLPALGPFMIKLSGQYQKRDGFIDVIENPFPQVFLARPASVRDTNDIDNHGVIAQVRVKPTDALTVDYAFDYTRFNQRPDYAQLFRTNQNGDARDIFQPSNPFGVAGFFPLDLYANRGRQSVGSIDADPLYEKVRTQGHALTIAQEFGPATLKSITAYRKLRFDDALDLDGSPLDLVATERHTKYHSFSQELQLTGDLLEGRLKYVLGGFYFNDKGTTLGPQRFFGGATSFQSDYSQKTEAYAAYAQLDFEVADGLVLVGGLRYNREIKQIERLLISQPDTPAATTLIDIRYGDVAKAKYNDLSPQATIRYEVNSGVDVYARFAKGFKSGGFNGESSVVTAPTAACPSGAPEFCDPYDPEEVLSYELGIKTRLLDNRLQLNVAGFWDEHKDIQIPVFLATGAAGSVILNAAKARIRGIEIEMLARPVEYLTANVSFGYTQPKYRRYIDGGIDVSDNRAFPQVPAYNASVGFDWRVIQIDWGKINIVSDLNFVSSYYTYPYALRTPSPSDQNANNTRSQGRTIVNARAILSEVPIGTVKAEFSVWVRNLFRENKAQNFIDFGPGFGGLTVAYFPDPRTYGLTLGARF